METLNLADNNLARTDKDAYQKLQRIIGFQYDRYTGMQTFTLPLLAQPLGHSLFPSCKLIVLMQEDRTWTVLLTLAFQISGKMHFPPPGEIVNWLINDERATSYVIDSNGHTVSKDFRIGADVMPGPLFLWVSAPVTMARTSGWISLFLTEDILQKLCRAGFADFRVAGMEFRLMGQPHANNGKPHSLGDYISGLRGFITQRYDSPETSALRHIADKIEGQEKSSRKVTRVTLGIIVVFFLLLFGSCLYLINRPSQNNINNNSIAIPSPSATEITSPKKDRSRKK